MTYYIALWINSKLLEIVTHPNPLSSFIFKHIQDLLNQDYSDYTALEQTLSYDFPSARDWFGSNKRLCISTSQWKGGSQVFCRPQIKLAFKNSGYLIEKNLQ